MRVEITLPDKIVTQIDELITSGIYQTRSEFLRAAAVTFLGVRTQKDSKIPLSEEEREFWILTLEVLNRDISLISGRYQFYKNTFDDDITPSQFREIYENYKENGVGSD